MNRKPGFQGALKKRREQDLKKRWLGEEIKERNGWWRFK